ncbi:MAG TPA: hypothetical protein PLQ49_00370 [Methanothrix sp.]|nr:hypothetical protein [Methanothrix sp.]
MRSSGCIFCLLLLVVLVFGTPIGSSIDSSEGFAYSSEDASAFSDFFAMEEPATTGEVMAYNPSGIEPTSVSFGDRTVSYYAYRSTYSGTNSLWIMGASSWTQRVVCPLGSYLSLLAYAPAGGRADFYEIYPDGRLLSRSYYFYQGYSRINFEADEVGRHVLIFAANNQPSNAVIVDVASGGWPPSPGPGTGPSPWPPVGSARVIFSSSWLRGYSVFVDGSYAGGDGSGGDPLDGTYSLDVVGDQYHTLEISSGGQTFSERGTFLSGVTYRLSI